MSVMRFAGLRRAPSERRNRGSVVIAIVLGLAGVLTVAPAAQALESRWPEVERYYMGLLNCTRTGGWVLADGSCKGYGSGRYSAARKPLDRRSGLSQDASRPYARLMAERGQMGHYLDGSPTDRMRRAGYQPGAWGENIGYWAGDPFEAVLSIHRMYQAERAERGIHWHTIKKKALKWVGVGVWREDGYTYLVVDFLGP